MKFRPILLLIVWIMTGGTAFGIELVGIAGGGNFNIQGKSFAERRFSTVYRQQFDFSCGSAALASLLTYHYDDIVDEQSVFVDMFQHGNQQKIKKEGFSMLDMKLYLERRGYPSDGFKINLDQLYSTGSPAITIINDKGYMHFVIIKGVDTHKILVGDPAQGVKIIARHEFEKMWGNRILFLIHGNLDPEVSYQQARQEWADRSAPLGDAVDRSSLAIFNVLRPGPWDFR
ncbi:C39 family peptidase [Nitrosomonas halophila]|uniref:Peptidase C39 domain-containing protein n=1 Tax=Nitrosomonas halophila TaxID=44576 RepID=A0A1H3DMC1_9PROT|nr:C39 family peptidase [Nitrosomonas halophila]SDX66799.1 hypothetical protein SAMN05421881_100557 [Nitrosomonas halophila]